MTVATWPIPDLPDLMLQDGFAGQGYGDGRLRPPTEQGGFSASRIRFATTFRPLAGIMQFTQVQLDLHDEFWQANQVRPFWFPDQQRHGRPITDDAGNALTDDTGKTLTSSIWYVVLFDSAPGQPSFLGFGAGGEVYRISLSFIILPWPV